MCILFTMLLSIFATNESLPIRIAITSFIDQYAMLNLYFVDSEFLNIHIFFKIKHYIIAKHDMQP